MQGGSHHIPVGRDWEADCLGRKNPTNHSGSEERKTQRLPTALQSQITGVGGDGGVGGIHCPVSQVTVFYIMGSWSWVMSIVLAWVGLTGKSGPAQSLGSHSVKEVLQWTVLACVQSHCPEEVWTSLDQAGPKPTSPCPVPRGCRGSQQVLPLLPSSARSCRGRKPPG